MLEQLLRSIARSASRRPALFLSIGAVVAILSMVYAALTLRINADTDDLIAPDRPFKHAYDAFLEEFGDLEYLYVVIATGDDRDRAQAAADFIGERLSAIDLLPDVLWAIEPAEQLRISTRAMSDEELEEFALAADAFSPLLESDSAETVALTAENVLQDLLRFGMTMDESTRARLGAAGFFLARIIAAGSSMQDEDPWYPGEGLSREYIASESGRLLFIVILPEKDYGTMAVIEEPLRRIRAVLDEARSAFPDLELGLTGKPVLQADEMSTTDRDMRRAAVIAIILVSVLFMIVIGGVWRPLLAVLALLIGMAWTFGLTTLIIGQLNLLSIVFTLVLVGVGIDFGIHIVARYRERLDHDSVEAALEYALATSGRGNVTGAVTSSIAFYMTLFTDFQGLRELGFIAGSGLLLCLISMTTMLPALLSIYERRWGRGRVRHMLGASLHDVGDRIWQRINRKPIIVLGACAVLSAAMIPGLLRIGFEENLLELQARGLESVEWEHRVLEDSADTWFGAIIVEDLSEVDHIVARAEDRPNIGRIGSVLDLIEPDSEPRDARRFEIHGRIRQGAIDPAEHDLPLDESVVRLTEIVDRIVRATAMVSAEDAAELFGVRDALRVVRERLESDDPPVVAGMEFELRHTVEHARDNLHHVLAGDLEPLREALPRAVRDRFVSEHGRFLVTVHPVENVWEFEPMKRFVADLRAVDPDATGVPITQFESMIEMRHAFMIAAGLAFTAVCVLLLVDLWSIRFALFAIVPLLVGLLWTVQLMGLLGVKFNLANFFAVPILIGISVDSGIHMIRRFRENLKEHPDDPQRAVNLGATRRAVFMTATTSMIGFGALLTASHRGLSSLGMVMALGSAACLLAALIVVPALLTLTVRRQRKRE